jgi:hypothetical protein
LPAVSDFFSRGGTGEVQLEKDCTKSPRIHAQEPAMNLPRWFVSTFLGTAAVCCVLYPVWSSRHPASARDSKTRAANPAKASFPPGPSVKATREAALEAFAQHPLSFERNVGQAAPNTQYVSRGRGYSLALSGDDAVLSLVSSDKPNSMIGRRAPAAKSAALRMSLVGANQKAASTGLDPLPDKVNYLIGNDPQKWLLHVPHYARVKYESVYPGIDLVYYGNQRRLEYDFVVAPGADPKQIRLSFDGTKSLKLDRATGDLVIATANGAELRHHRPVIYQMNDNEKTSIAGSYRILDQKHATFALASYDTRKSLVIDPTLDFTTTFAETGQNFAAGIAVDNAGNAYITGITDGGINQFGASGPYFCTTGTTCTWAFVVKILAHPQGLFQFSTYIGADGLTTAFAIAADATGPFIAGRTSAANFLTNAKYALGSNNAFAAHFEPNGETIDWVVGLGGHVDPATFGTNTARAIAVDANHAAYIAGLTNALDFPTTEKFAGGNASRQAVSGCSVEGASPGCQNGFVAKVPPDGNFDDGGYSTYLGGSVSDLVNGIAVDGSGDAVVTGATASGNFPAIATFYGQAPIDEVTAFVTRFNSTGSAAIYSSFLGGYEDLVTNNGPAEDSGNAIAVNSSGQAYITGQTCSTNFPTTPGALQTSQSICSTLTAGTSAYYAGFVTVLDGLGGLRYSTLFAQPGPSNSGAATVGASIAINSRGEVYVGGYTDAASVFSTPNPGAGSGNNTGFVAKFAPDLSYGEWATFVGNQVTGVAAAPPACPVFGIFCAIQSRLYTQVYATGITFVPGTGNNDYIPSFYEWTDNEVVFGQPLPISSPD